MPSTLFIRETLETLARNRINPVLLEAACAGFAPCRRHARERQLPMMYHVPVERRSQRCRIGMSPPPPHVATVLKDVLELMMYHVPVEGRKTPMSVLPSPSYSPGTGMSPAPPHVYAEPSPVAEFTMYPTPPEGRNTGM